MGRIPRFEMEYLLCQPPTRSELPERDARIITFERTSQQSARITVDGREMVQTLVYHSPTGLEFGYGGSGPADTALNILALVVSPKEANRLHQWFKEQMLLKIPREGGRMKMQDVVDWIRARYAFETSDAALMAREKEMQDNLDEIGRLDEEARREEGKS
jgi:hypothetical protein